MRPTLLLAAALSLFAQPEIPKVWDDAAIADFELPLARPQHTPKPVTADAYYKLPVRPIWKSYPVYHPDKAPPGYFEWLRAQQPEQVWNAADLKTDADWVRAGETVFDAPIRYDSLAARPMADPPYLAEKVWFDRVNPPVAHDGSIPGYSYVIRTKGKVEIGVLSCAGCHTRIMPNGAVVKGAQGNFPFDAAMAEDLIASDALAATRAANKKLFNVLYFAPWFTGDFAAVFQERFNVGYVAKLLSGHNPGSMSPHGAAPWQPVQIPDLFGVADRRYLGPTGLRQNRGLADLMRYAASKQGGEPSRYSDEQLYALAKYLTGLKRPSSPYKLDKFAKQGEKVFEREGCGGCHTAPLYTNNKLSPADGFPVPAEHRQKYEILPAGVGTDPGLTMQTRLGTGYYKVPSLRGLWMRGALEHSGRVTTLEEWLSPTRLEYNKGHEFGLKLNGNDRFALIAFLKTL